MRLAQHQGSSSRNKDTPSIHHSPSSYHILDKIWWSSETRYLRLLLGRHCGSFWIPKSTLRTPKRWGSVRRCGQSLQLRSFASWQLERHSVLRAPDAPQNVRFCRNPRKNEFPENARKKEIGKIIFLYFPKIGRIRMNSDEIQKIKPLVFHSMIFCADGFGRVFFWIFNKNFGKLRKNNGRI